MKTYERAGTMAFRLTVVLACCAAMAAWAAWAVWAARAGTPVGDAAPYAGGDVYADTWVATDGAARVVPGFAECGPPKRDRWVGIFYWTWHTPGRGGPNDNSKILATARNGVVHWPDDGAPYHWGEPELGYYLMTDPFVIRKHASMLADAGVDVILFDTTNPPFTWKEEYEALCREYTAMRQEGARTPAIAFVAPFGDPRPVTDQLWRDLYKPGRWKDLWFRWKGKPLLLADPAYVQDAEQKRFFTFRKPMPDYWTGPTGPDQWSWLEVYPQHVFRNRQGEAEQMSVGVAQNALPHTPGPAPMSDRVGAMGRSWHDGKKDDRAGAVNLGLNFDEQWRRALAVNPQFVFVTGWNEWIAGRYTSWSHYTDADCYYPGGLFVDEYTQEYSRDCEPMRGGHGDNYYYQLASWIRRFKGVRPRPKAKGPSRITIDGRFDDWGGVTPEFRDTIGDTVHRNHAGYGSLVYRNDTGRNDIVISKAAYDRANLYFFVQTLKPMTPRTDRQWMLLFLDTDQNAKTGWAGYDYVVNLEVPSDTETVVKAWRKGAWATVGRARYRVAGNRMEIAVPRAMLGQTGQAGKPPAFDFHWADNPGSLTDISNFGTNGDSAPNRRWNYRFEVERRADRAETSGPVQPLGRNFRGDPALHGGTVQTRGDAAVRRRGGETMRVRDGIHAATALTAAVLLLSAAVPGAIAQKQHPKKPSKVPTPSTTAEGVAVYQKNGCGACHMIGGKGGKAGPDLSHIGKTWSVAKITKVVRNPKSLNTKAKMPAFPASKIGDKEMKSLAAYLGNLK